MGAEETTVPVATEQAPSTPDAPTGDQAVATEPSATVDSFTTIDPSTLPAELKALWDETYKSMQGDYTRKTQGISDIRSKADVFDSLMSNPKFTALLDQFTNPTPQAPASPQDLATLLQTNPEEAVKAITDQIRAEMEQKVSPLVQDFESRNQAEAAAKAESTYNDLLAKYPDLPEYENEVAERVAKGYDVEEAIKAVRYDRAYQQGVDSGAQAVAKRDTAAQPQSRPATGTQSGTAGSWEEAVEMAKRAVGK